MIRILQKSSLWLLALTLVIGPLWMGSYYRDWRWPLIIVASLAGGLMAVTPPAQKSGRGTWVLKVMAALLILLGAQGGWMWWNARANFTQEASIFTGFAPWGLMALNDVPFPNWPGAQAQNEAWDRMTYIGPALLLVWGAARWARYQPATTPWVIKTIFITGVSVAWLGLVFRWTGAESVLWLKSLMEPQYKLFFSTFRSPGIATAYMNVSLALGLSLLLDELYRLVKGGRGVGPACGYFLGSTVIFCGSLSAGSKAGMAFAGLTLLLWALLNIKVLWRVIQYSSRLVPSGSPHERNLVAAAVLMILVLGGLSVAGTTVMRWQDAEASDYQTLKARSEINEVQIKMLKHPDWGALGLGPGSFHPLFPYFSYEMESQGQVVYAHNDFLQTLIEWGWLGFTGFTILMAGACLIPLWRSWSNRKRRVNRPKRIHLRGLAIAIFVCLLHATVDFPFQIESIAITLAVLVGLAWGDVPRQELEK